MVRDIQFTDLEQLLFKIGFTKVPTTGSQQIYQYPLSGTLVILPAYEKQAYVQPVHLVAVRRILVENGLINTNSFDSFLGRLQAKAIHDKFAKDHLVDVRKPNINQ